MVEEGVAQALYGANSRGRLQGALGPVLLTIVIVSLRHRGTAEGHGGQTSKHQSFHGAHFQSPVGGAQWGVRFRWICIWTHSPVAVIRFLSNGSLRSRVKSARPSGSSRPRPSLERRSQSVGRRAHHLDIDLRHGKAPGGLTSPETARGAAAASRPEIRLNLLLHVSPYQRTRPRDNVILPGERVLNSPFKDPL